MLSTMLRRAFIMAAVQNSRGRSLRADMVPHSKGGRGRYHVSTVQSKPPSGRGPGSSQSEKALVGGFGNLSLRDSARSSASSITGPVSRRQYSAGRRPVTVKNVEDIATLLREELVKNVVIVAGAGISTPSGIPDFRSPGTGLYDNLQQYSIPYAEAIFDIDYFHHNPRPFFTLAKELYPTGKYRPNYLHYFAKLLYDRGLLLRFYTQNIDGLERIAGIPPDKLVEAHGTFSTATCVTCKQKCSGDEIREKIFEGKFPRCKRATCNGIVKPDIVFFGEELPKRFYFYLKDMLQTDLVIIMGTSLEVQPFAGIIDTVRFTVPRILFNRMAVGPFKRQKRPKDFVCPGDLLEQMEQFVAMVGWTQDMVDLITRKEGYFKLAFPPPVPTSQTGGDKKAVKAAKPDPLAAMWRQNAQINFYSDSDSSDTDSGVTPSDSDTSSTDSEHGAGRGGAGAGRGGAGRGTGKAGSGQHHHGAGKSSSSSTVSSSSSGYVSNTSTGSLRGTASKTDGKGGSGDKSGPLLSKRNNNGANSGNNTNSGPKPRLFGHQSQAANNSRGATGSKAGASPLLFRDTGAHKTAWTDTGKEGSKPPPAPQSNNPRKPPAMAASRGGGLARQPLSPQFAPPPGTHAVKPRSNSVTKAVPEKLHTRSSENLKSALYPRVKSAQPAKLAYRHRMQPPPYDSHMLAINGDLSDSSSSDDIRRDVSDDTSDDSS